MSPQLNLQGVAGLRVANRTVTEVRIANRTVFPLASSFSALATDRIADAPNLSNVQVDYPPDRKLMYGTWTTVGATSTGELGLSAERLVWHRFFMPNPGVITVSQNPSSEGWPGALTFTGPDTYLYLLQGPADGSALTNDSDLFDALVASSDDDGGATRGKVVYDEPVGGCWFYVGHSLYDDSEDDAVDHQAGIMIVPPTPPPTVPYFRDFESGAGDGWANGSVAPYGEQKAGSTRSMNFYPSTERVLGGFTIGQSYTFSVWFKALNAGTTVTWGIVGNTVATPLTTGWVQYSRTFTATETTHVMTAASSSGGIQMDDVRVQAS